MPADLEVAHLKVSRITFAAEDGEFAVIEPARGTSGEVDRLSIKSLKGPMEIEVLPSDDFNSNSRIVTQIQLMGRLRAGDWRKRFDATIFNDRDGGEAVYLGSSLTGGGPSSETSMPMVFRTYAAHEIPQQDVIFHPSDATLELKDYDADGNERNSVRKTLKQWMDSAKGFDEL